MPFESWGDWGVSYSDEDFGTPPEKMRRVYFSLNSGGVTVVGWARVPMTWTVRRVREHGILRYVECVNVSFDVLSLRALLAA